LTTQLWILGVRYYDTTLVYNRWLVPPSRGRHRSGKSTAASKTEWMMSGERHLHKYLLVCISQRFLAWISWQPLLSLSRELLAAVQFAGLKKNIMRLSALESGSATTNKTHVFQPLRNKSAHVLLYLRNTKLLSSRTASKPNSCAEGASTGKQ
jgi:hypothetical protein